MHAGTTQQEEPTSTLYFKQEIGGSSGIPSIGDAPSTRLPLHQECLRGIGGNGLPRQSVSPAYTTCAVHELHNAGSEWPHGIVGTGGGFLSSRTRLADAHSDTGSQ